MLELMSNLSDAFWFGVLCVIVGSAGLLMPSKRGLLCYLGRHEWFGDGWLKHDDQCCLHCPKRRDES